MTGLQKIPPTLDLLLRARERLSDPAMWTNHKTGRCGDARCIGLTFVDLGRQLNASAASADAINLLANHTGGVARITDWNDSHTHAEVLALLDRVIQESV